MFEFLKENPWREFLSVARNSSDPLLKRLDEFCAPILISGCQRSGTTMLTRLINQSPEVADIEYAHPDDELDAAMILYGDRPFSIVDKQRYCLQTTYLNDAYTEYYQHDNFKLIWVVRNPHSVVNSILHNWAMSALDDLYVTCGEKYANSLGVKHLPRSGFFESKIHKACYSYAGKSSQAIELKKKLRKDQIYIVDYDDFITHSDILLPRIFHFLGLDYLPEFGNCIHKKSLHKKDGLSKKEMLIVDELCIPAYEKIKMICDHSC